MMDITLLQVIQVLMLLHVQDIWPDFILTFSFQDGSMVLLKSKILDILFIQELFTELDPFHIKVLLEQLTEFKILTH
jgi:hypothetical protein